MSNLVESYQFSSYLVKSHQILFYISFANSNRCHDIFYFLIRLNQTVGRWKELQDKCKGMINLLDELKEFHDTNDTLNNWLNSKARMMNVLGPIASDPRLVQNQMSQIAVMREDFNEKVPTRDR